MRSFACLNFKQDMSWGYIEGYRKAGSLVAEQMLQGFDIDYLIYPMGFLYRHHVELQLKYLIEKCGELLEEGAAPAPTHNLERLWNMLRTKIKEIESDSEEFLLEIDDGIKKLIQLDGTGQEFRYSKLKNEDRCLDHLQLVDIGKLYESLETLSSNLQSIHDHIDVCLSDRSDYYDLLEQLKSD